MWQYIVVGLILLAALFYLVRYIVRAISTGEHDCPDCEVSELSKAKKKKPSHFNS